MIPSCIGKAAIQVSPAATRLIDAADSGHLELFHKHQLTERLRLCDIE